MYEHWFINFDNVRTHFLMASRTGNVLNVTQHDVYMVCHSILQKPWQSYIFLIHALVNFKRNIFFKLWSKNYMKTTICENWQGWNLLWNNPFVSYMEDFSMLSKIMLVLYETILTIFKDYTNKTYGYNWVLCKRVEFSTLMYH